MALPDFEAWAIFSSVVEHNSFTGAARALGMSKATVSKAVSRLETDIDAPLFNRSSRRLVLTETGSGLVEHARRIVAEGEAAMEAAHEESSSVAGLIRMTAPLSLGVEQVAPALAEFMARHPAVTIDLQLSDAFVDMIGDGFDLALRVADLPDSALRARKLRDVTLHTLASPAYLAEYGEPTHPAKLAGHRCISYSNNRRPESWNFTDGEGNSVAVRADGPMRVNNGGAMLPVLCAGQGIGQLPDTITDGDIAAGRLKPILTDWSAGWLALYLVTPPSRLRTRRVSLLIEHLVERLSG